MKFLHETGVIVDDHNSALTIIDGSMGAVEFPEELIWNLHKARPGSVFELAHTHPNGMSELSGRDEQTLKTWAFALYPFPLRMSVIAAEPFGDFTYKRFVGIVEPREHWLARGKGVRGFQIVKELDYLYFGTQFDEYQNWPGFLLHRSYEL